MPAIVLNANAGEPLTFSAPVAVGQSLVILLGDGYGNGESLYGVVDTPGNTYDLTSIGRNADGDGDVMAASTIVTRRIAAGDTLTLTIGGATGVFHAYGVSFPVQRSYDHAAQVGLYGDGTITVNTTARAGDLLIAFAAAQDALTQDPGNGWVDVLGVGGDAPNNLMAVAYQTATADGTFTYQPSRTGGPGGDYAAAAIVVLGAPPPFIPGEASFTTLDPAWADENWGINGGYYIHDNYLFLDGGAFNSPAVSAVGTAILSIPSGLRPATTISVELHFLARGYYRPFNPAPGTPSELNETPSGFGLPMPETLSATIDPSGVLTLTTLPPFINVAPTLTNLESNFYTPGVSTPDYDQPFKYDIFFAGLKWPLGPIDDAGGTWVSLAPYLDTNFTDIDSQVRVSQARIELRGRVQAVDNGAGFAQPLIKGLPTVYRGVGGGATIAETPDFEAVLQNLGGGWVVLRDDTRYDQDNVGLDEPYDFKFPCDVGGAEPFFPLVENNFFTEDGLGEMTGGWDTGRADSTVAGLVTHPTTYGWASIPTYPGGRRTAAHYTESGQSIVTIPHPPFPIGSPTVSVGVAVDASIDAILAAMDPQPDWVGLAVTVSSSFSNGVHGYEVSIGADEAFDFLGYRADPLPRFVNGATILPSDPIYFNSVRGVKFWDDPPRQVFGYIAQPGGAYTYPYDQNNFAKSMIWEPSAIPKNYGGFFNGLSSGSTFGDDTVTLNIHFGLIPFWNTGHDFLLAGQIVTLDDAGWAAPFKQGPPPLLTPGTLLAGPGSAGRIPWLRSAGRFGGADAALGPPGSANAAPQRGGDGGSAGVLRIP